MSTARALLDEALEPWTRDGARAPARRVRVGRPHVLDAWGRAQIALYAGEAHESLAAAGLAFARLDDASLAGVVYLRAALLDVRGRALSALAAVAKPASFARAKLLRRAEADAEELRCQPMASARPLARLLDASIAKLRGDDGPAREALLEALAAFHDGQMDLHAAVTRRRLGALGSGAQAKGLTALARAWMGVETVKSSRRIARLLSPGWE